MKIDGGNNNSDSGTKDSDVSDFLAEVMSTADGSGSDPASTQLRHLKLASELNQLEFDEPIKSIDLGLAIPSVTKDILLTQSKSLRRERYEQYVQEIREKHGSLEDIRQRLGLSRRKLCGELMVDPSAWSRWTASQQPGSRDEAPPHVYKTLVLMLEAQAKEPLKYQEKSAMGFVQPENFKQNMNELREETASAIEAAIDKSRSEILHFALSQIENFRNESQSREVLNFGWKIMLILNLVLVLYVLFR
jgi:transcriptional regulator with XRE-family HTH domain